MRDVEKFSEKALPTVIAFFVNATFVASDASIIFLNREIAFLNDRRLSSAGNTRQIGPYLDTFALAVPPE
jgi:hypothetical protein